MLDTAFYEENRIEIVGEYDVIVVGGGIAGVSAALAARRNHCSVLLLEKSVMLGGLATLGLIAIYLPLCDGRGRKVIGGIAEELLQLSIQYGYDNLSEYWRQPTAGICPQQRYRTHFSPPEFVVALDELMMREGVDLLFDTLFCKPVVQNGWCSGVIVENKAGRLGYRGKVIIDATGDSDVFFRAGGPCVETDNWLSYWAFATDLEGMKKAVEFGDIMKGIHLLRLGGDNAGTTVPADARKYKGTDAGEITEFVLEGRRWMKKVLSEQGYFKARKKEKSLLTLPGMPQFRTTRRIKGIYELTGDDVSKHFSDSIGLAGDWRKAGPVYEIPYRSLITDSLYNILAAGRNISSGGDAWEVTRVIPVAALTGQAAGTAASLAVKENCRLRDVPLDKLQQKLQEAGVLIH